MQPVFKRLSSLVHLARPLALAFVGIVLLSLGVAYFVTELYHSYGFPDIISTITLQSWPRWARGLLFTVVGLVVLGAGIWQLSGVVVIPLTATPAGEDEVVLGYRRVIKPPRIAVLLVGGGVPIRGGLGL